MLTIINYHYIRENYSQKHPSFFGVTPEEFENQIDILTSLGTIISISDLEKFKFTSHIKERLFLITFDDGLKEQYEYAIPILRRKGIPAIFFISTLPLINQRMLNVHKIHFIRSMIDDDEFLQQILSQINFCGLKKELPRLDGITKIYKYDKEQAGLIKYFLNFALNDFERELIIEPIFNEIFNFKELEMVRSFYLNKEEIQYLGKNYSIGTHSHSHRALGLLDKVSITNEISTSLEIIQNISGCQVNCISYPYGYKEACSNGVAEISRLSGIRYGFTFEHAINENISDSFHLARFSNNDLPGGNNYSLTATEYENILPRAAWFINNGK